MWRNIFKCTHKCIIFLSYTCIMSARIITLANNYFLFPFYITQSVCVQPINNLMCVCVCVCVCNSHAEHSIMLPVTQKIWIGLGEKKRTKEAGSLKFSNTRSRGKWMRGALKNISGCLHTSLPKNLIPAACILPRPRVAYLRFLCRPQI